MGLIDKAIDGAKAHAALFEKQVKDYIDKGADEDSQEFWNLPENACYDSILRVHCYGGGPAGGVEFVFDNKDSSNWESARTWHQDWGTPIGYADLDEETADFLWWHWGMG